jgi:hypothetical protein
VIQADIPRIPVIMRSGFPKRIASMFVRYRAKCWPEGRTSMLQTESYLETSLVWKPISRCSISLRKADEPPFVSQEPGSSPPGLKTFQASKNLCSRQRQIVAGMWLLYDLAPEKPTLFAILKIFNSP